MFNVRLVKVMFSPFLKLKTLSLKPLFLEIVIFKR